MSASAASTGVLAWGGGNRGQLGDATTERSDVPMGVSGLSGVTAVSAGADFSLALLSDGTVMAWGENGFGELGDGSSGEDSDVPVAVSGLSEVTQVAAGYNYSLALLRNGTVMAWGLNEAGSLGDGTTEQVSQPTSSPVSGLSEVTAIAAGLGGVSTALLENGTVMDWGLDSVGLLGDGDTTGPETCEGIPCSRVPVAVSDLSGVTQVAGGFEHRLALLSSGKVMAWGNGADGMLGLGSETGSDVPVEVSALGEAASIATGQYFSLVTAGTLAPLPTAPVVTEGTEPNPGRTQKTGRIQKAGTTNRRFRTENAGTAFGDRERNGCSSRLLTACDGRFFQLACEEQGAEAMWCEEAQEETTASELRETDQEEEEEVRRHSGGQEEQVRAPTHAGRTIAVLRGAEGKGGKG